MWVWASDIEVERIKKKENMSVEWKYKERKGVYIWVYAIVLERKEKNVFVWERGNERRCFITPEKNARLSKIVY